MPQIGIWGPTHSGKTTYMASLFLAMKTDGVGKEWEMFPKDESAEQFKHGVSIALSEGTFPKETDPGTMPRYEYVVSYKDKTLDISFMDSAGALIGSVHHPKFQEYFNMLNDCHSILMMIDPDAESHSFGEKNENYASTITRLVDTLRGSSNRSEINLAVCITKVDLDRHWNAAPHKPREYLKKIIGVIAYNTLFSEAENDRTFRRKQGRGRTIHVEVFPVSVAGRYRTPKGYDRPNVIRLGDRNEVVIAKTEAWEPYGVLKPLEWIFLKDRKR